MWVFVRIISALAICCYAGSLGMSIWVQSAALDMPQPWFLHGLFLLYAIGATVVLVAPERWWK